MTRMELVTMKPIFASNASVTKLRTIICCMEYTAYRFTEHIEGISIKKLVYLSYFKQYICYSVLFLSNITNIKAWLIEL